MRVAARGAGAANGTCKGHSNPAPAPSPTPRYGKVSRAYVTPDKLLSSQPFGRALASPTRTLLAGLSPTFIAKSPGAEKFELPAMKL